MRRLTALLCVTYLLSSALIWSRENADPVQSIMIEMRDGAHLATALMMPVDYTPERYPKGVPAVLVCTPYDKSRPSPVDRWRDCLTAHGYAFAVQDMRGFYASAKAGKGRSRHTDGYDTVEWLAAQAWCNGRVGMIGYSHLGAVQYETAVTAPPHLVCAIPAQAPANYYTDSLYPPVFRKADLETILRGRFNDRTQQLINRRKRNWQHAQLDRFNTPMLHSAGWYDFYTEGAIEMFRALRQHGGPKARPSQRLLIGPWGHGVLQEENLDEPLALPGGMVYPANAKLDWETDVWLPWFDYWCKDKSTGVMNRPAVLYYLMGDVDDPEAPGNVWVQSEDFPPVTTSIALYLHADQTLKRMKPPQPDGALRYHFDPADPVPTVGRRHPRLPVKGPYDQRQVESRQDVLLFTTSKRDRPLIIVGQISVHLWATSDCADTDFTAKLTDVYPDGKSMLITDSIVKGRYRNTFLKEELLTPGETYEFVIDLGCTAIVLAPGHRLRLAVSSSNFDRFDINPNTGEPYGDHAVTRALLTERLRADPFPGEATYSRTAIATNTIFMNAQRPSHVILPVLSEIPSASPGRR